jgi:Tfp pilus assembly protein PilX
MNHFVENPPRNREQGGIAILTVLMLLVLATVVAFAMGRVTIRELAVSGTTWQGAKASEAAEAGLDWFILWSNPDNQNLAAERHRQNLVEALTRLNAQSTWSDPSINTYLLDSGKTWDRAVRIPSSETDTDSDMVFANSGTGFRQSSATTGNSVVQSFELTLRYLGTPLINTVSSGTGSTTGVGSGKTGRQLNLYQLQSTGRASVPIGGSDYMRFLAHREMFVTVVP